MANKTIVKSKKTIVESNQTIVESNQNHNEDLIDHLEISRVNDLIYLGSCEHPLSDSEDFRKLEIDVIINCAKEITYHKTHKYITYNFPIVEKYPVTMLENIDKAIETIVDCLANNKKIYIHCVTGITRAPAILIYYFMSQQNMTYYDALDLVKMARPIVEIDTEVEDQFKAIEQD